MEYIFSIPKFNPIIKENNFPWTSNKSIDEIKIQYTPRKTSLQKLMNIVDLSDNMNSYELDIDFIKHYANYFFILNPQTIYELESLPLHTDGKSGTVYQMRDKYILKHLHHIKWKPYLSLKIISINSTITSRNESFLYHSLLMKKSIQKSPELYCIHCPNDNFHNECLIHLILDELLGNHPNYLHHYDSFLSYDENSTKLDGFHITELANLGDLSTFLENWNGMNEDTLLDLVKQILEILYVLKNPKIGFLHSDLKTKNIFVHYQDQKIYYKLADFDKSSIFFHHIRFFNHSYNYILGKTFPSPFYLHYDISGSYYYYDMNESGIYGNWIGFHEFIMSNPEGFFSSFDIYTFFYSLILEKPVYQFMLKHPSHLIWKVLEFLFHKDEEQEWIKFITNIKEIFNGNIQGNTKSIRFYWKQFLQCSFKLRYDIEFIYQLIGIQWSEIKHKIPFQTCQLIENKEDKKDYPILKISFGDNLCTKKINESI